MSAWSHLANAKHIDRIIAHVKANSGAWAIWAYDAYDAAYEAAYEASRDAAQDAARGAARGAAWRVAYEALRDAAWITVRDALLALVAWDYAGDLMDLPADQVKVLAILGDQAAILLYPAIRAIETTQESA
jgi:hypothetical protein